MPRQSDPSQPPYRFIWETPIVTSPHHPGTIYTGGQMLLKSADRGDHWTAISPDLSTHPSDKILPSSEGRLPGGIPWFAISTISESPLTAGEIWAGTSDGNVWVSATTAPTGPMLLPARRPPEAELMRTLPGCALPRMWPAGRI